MLKKACVFVTALFLGWAGISVQVPPPEPVGFAVNIVQVPLLESAGFAVSVSVGIDSAQAQVIPCPPPCLPPPPPPPPKPPAQKASPTKSRGGGFGKAFVVGQIAANVCSAVVLGSEAYRLGSGEQEVKRRRELTPIEAAHKTAGCGSVVGVVAAVSAAGHADNECTYAVAREAWARHNTPRGREELLFRIADGRGGYGDESYFGGRYHEAYNNCVQEVQPKQRYKKKKKKKTKRR